RVKALWRRRDARVILGVAGGAGLAFFGYWTVASAVADISPAPDRPLHLGTGELLRQVATVRVPFYRQQVVGELGYGARTIAPAWLTRYRWLPLALAACAALFHGYALARVMTRYQVGISARMNPLHGSWLPPGGPVLPLALLAVGLALLVVLVTRQPIRTATT